MGSYKNASLGVVGNKLKIVEKASAKKGESAQKLQNKKNYMSEMEGSEMSGLDEKAKKTREEDKKNRHKIKIPIDKKNLNLGSSDKEEIVRRKSNRNRMVDSDNEGNDMLISTSSKPVVAKSRNNRRRGNKKDSSKESASDNTIDCHPT